MIVIVYLYVLILLNCKVSLSVDRCNTYSDLTVPLLTALDLPIADNTSGVYNIFQTLSSTPDVKLEHGDRGDCYRWKCKSPKKKGRDCQYCLPFVFVAGFSKCGTTALCSKLSLHPRIKPYRKKEINIFTKFFDEFSWAEFEKRVVDTHPNVTGDLWLDCTASAFRDYNAAVHLLQYSPRTKLIFMVRDPWQRLGSWIEMNKRQKPKDSYRRYNYEWKALLREHQAGRRNRFTREVVTTLATAKYIGSFLYAEVLLLWRVAFGEDRILVLDHHSLENDPQRTMRRVEEFLGIAPHDYDMSQLLSLSVNTRFTSLKERGALEGIEAGDDRDSAPLASVKTSIVHRNMSSRIHAPYEIEDKQILAMTRKLFWPSLCLFEKIYKWRVKIVTSSEL